MCIGSNSVNQAQDLMSVTKFEDFPNSLLPNVKHGIWYDRKGSHDTCSVTNLLVTAVLTPIEKCITSISVIRTINLMT